MKKKWDFEDILDLQYFSNRDEGKDCDEEKLHQRDRHIFLECQTHDTPPIHSDHHSCLFLWLQKRRKEEMKEADASLPGTAIGETFAVFRLLLFVLGTVFGCSLALSYFVYTGQTPLNVFHFLVIFILPQLLFLALLMIKGIFPLQRRLQPSSLHRLLTSLLSKLFFILQKRIFSRFTPRKRTAITTLFSREHGILFLWPLFLAGQLFGIGFNIGILAVTLLKITTTDLAFGWQSTLHLGPENLFRIVQAIALPWSWLLSSDLSYPSLMEIEGSRIVLKDSMLHLLTTDLTSWWPFLLLCLLTYGLFPRILLIIYAAFMQCRFFKNQLKKSRYDRTVKRMLTPFLSTQAPPEYETKETAGDISEVGTSPAAREEGREKTVLVLIPDDLFDDMSLEMAERIIGPGRYIPTERKRIFGKYSADQDILGKIAADQWQEEQGIIIFIEAWMVPLQEHIRFLETVNESVPEIIEIGMVLLGRQKSRYAFTPARDNDIRMWQQKMGKLNRRLTFLQPSLQETEGDQTAT